MSFGWKKISFISALILCMSFSHAFAQDTSSPTTPTPSSPSTPAPTSSTTPPGMMKPNYEGMTRNLGLTADQKQKLDAIMQSAKTKADPIMQSIREKKSALMQYLFTPQATREEALAKAKEINDLRYQLEGIHIDSILQMKTILTPAQQQKFLQLHQQRMMKFGQQR